jgi:hypothetical protein
MTVGCFSGAATPSSSWNSHSASATYLFILSKVKAFKAKLVHLEGNLTAAVLAWNGQNTLSAVLLINLQTTNVTVLREV